MLFMVKPIFHLIFCGPQSWFSKVISCKQKDHVCCSCGCPSAADTLSLCICKPGTITQYISLHNASLAFGFSPPPSCFCLWGAADSKGQAAASQSLPAGPGCLDLNLTSFPLPSPHLSFYLFSLSPSYSLTQSESDSSPHRTAPSEQCTILRAWKEMRSRPNSWYKVVGIVWCCPVWNKVFEMLVLDCTIFDCVICGVIFLFYFILLWIVPL